MSKVQTMPLEIWTDINGNAARTQFKGGTKYIRADAQATVEALQRERDEAKKMEAVQKEVADNQTWHVRELRTALDAEREKVRTVEHELARIVKRNQGGYIGDRIAIDKCLTIIRTLDATTPAEAT